MCPVSISGFSRRGYSGIARIFHFWDFYGLNGYWIGLLDHLVYFLNRFCGLYGRRDYLLAGCKPTGSQLSLSSEFQIGYYTFILGTCSAVIFDTYYRDTCHLFNTRGHGFSNQ